MIVEKHDRNAIQTETVKTDLFEMDSFRFGRGEKKMVVLPGLSIQSVTSFANAVSAEYDVMKDDFSVYVFDKRRRPRPTYSIEEMACDTALVMEKCGLENVFLFGASLGGMVAFEIAARFPDLVKKLAVASTPLFVNETRFAPVNGWIEKARMRDGEGLYLDFGRLIYPPALFETYRQALSEAGKTLTGEDFSRFIVLANACKGCDFRLKADRIRCPLFAAASRDDRIFGKDVIREIVDAFCGRPGFEYHLYDGYGHAVYDAAPDFRDRLYRFFMKPVG